jgi:hypothetical protein
VGRRQSALRRFGQEAPMKIMQMIRAPILAAMIVTSAPALAVKIGDRAVGYGIACKSEKDLHRFYQIKASDGLIDAVYAFTIKEPRCVLFNADTEVMIEDSSVDNFCVRPRGESRMQGLADEQEPAGRLLLR